MKKREAKKFETLNIIKNVALKNVCGNDPTEYYRRNHNHIPAWILYYLREDIINYDDVIELFKTTITIVRKFRNKIAHNLKIITYRTENKIILKILKNHISSNKILKKG